MNDSYSLIAATAFGLEAVVKRELAQLGYEARVTSPGWIEFTGDALAIVRANLWLRTADRILIKVASFPAADFDALFDQTKALPWDQFIPSDASFPVVGRSRKSQLSSVPACQRAVKRAVVDSLLASHGVTTLPETGSLFKIEIALLNDQATLTLDTTGPSLHKRGYRTLGSLAPLKETLAAALVQLSFWNPERPLVDPFCGSGTIPIEAVMLGRNMAPGLQRTFPCQQWPWLPTSCWTEACTEADDLIAPPLAERVVGSDVDGRVLRAARANAEAAGVADEIHFQPRDFQQLRSPRKYGCLITNPPYGQRLGETMELAPLYESFPEVLSRLPTWSHFILTSYPDLEQLIGKQADRRRKLYNGRIECCYYQFHGPRKTSRSADHDLATAEVKPSSPPPTSAAAFGSITEKAKEQAELFERRLKKRARHLRRWPSKLGIHCFRLYERDIPEIPLIVDRYGDHLHITEYERPHDRDVAQHDQWLESMSRTAAAALDIDYSHVFLKRRQRQTGTRQHEHLESRNYRIHVAETDLKFIVNLSDYVDTGLFLDHRIARSMIRQQVEGKRFLNLFGYTGAFTVYAAAGGASETTTVDSSKTYLNWAQENLTLNQLMDSHHHFIRADAREFLNQLDAETQFDLAVVDPPTFSNRKESDSDWSVQRDHVGLLNDVLEHITPGGVVLFSTNFRRFKMDEAELKASQVHEISKQTVPEDFRNRRIHRCWRIEK